MRVRPFTPFAVSNLDTDPLQKLITQRDPFVKGRQ